MGTRWSRRWVVGLVLLVVGLALVVPVLWVVRPWREREVVWTHEDARGRMASFAITPEEAQRMYADAQGDAGFDLYGQPFVVGRYYVFPEGPPTKTDRSLSGIYINGDTGEVETRHSDKRIGVGERFLPEEPWIRIQRIRGQWGSTTEPTTRP